jgi:murein hydrolase activator
MQVLQYRRDMREWVFSLVLCILTFGLFAQTKEQLDRERQRIIKEIETTNKYLTETKKSKETALKDAKAMSDLVENRKKLADNIKAELSLADQTITNASSNIDSLKSSFEKVKTQYGAFLRQSYVYQLANNKWVYLLSSNSLNVFILRWRYLSQFQTFKDQKLEEVNALSKILTDRINEVSTVKESKSQLLQIEQETLTKLESDKLKKDKILQSLSNKEKDLMVQLSKKQTEREKLNQAIERIIIEQMRIAEAAEKKAAEKRAAEKKAADLASGKNRKPNEAVDEDDEANKSKNKADKTFSTELKALSKNFEDNKSRLPWPVGSGSIGSRFGNQPHPSIKGLTINNNGIDIHSSSPQSVKAVFDGEVVSVNFIPGYIKTMVIIKHGSYYTVYSSMQSATVSKGSKVKAGDTLGIQGVNDDGKSEVHFELWRDKSKQNPESWLRRK